MRRRAVSLLEVLFSLGVIAIGLLGVMALLPLGLFQMGKGNIADRSSRVGLNAVEEFEILGMRRPDAWIHADGTPVQSPNKPATVAPPHLPVGYSFCIDPRFTARSENQTSAGQPVVSGGAPYFDARFFPYYSWPIPASSSGQPSPPAAPPTYLFNDTYGTRVIPFTQNGAHPRMIRLSLRQAAGQPLNIGPAAPGSTPYDLGARLGLSHANMIFVSNDDLAFVIPQDEALLPNQVFPWKVGADGSWGVAGADDNGDGSIDEQDEQGWFGSDDIPVIRDYDGATSWMATLVPRADAGGFITETYLLSIVVFQDRPLPVMFVDEDASGGYTAGEESDNERVVDVASFEGGGFSGGDLTLSGTNAAQLDFSAGDWIMLGGSAGVGGSEAPAFRWYRVVATDSEPEAVGTTFQRVVTLQGADWQRPEWHLASSAAGFRPTQATIVSGVVAVYEKIIRLESNVGWPQ